MTMIVSLFLSFGIDKKKEDGKKPCRPVRTAGGGLYINDKEQMAPSPSSSMRRPLQHSNNEAVQ